MVSDENIFLLVTNEDTQKLQHQKDMVLEGYRKFTRNLFFHLVKVITIVFHMLKGISKGLHKSPPDVCQDMILITISIVILCSL